MCFMIHTGGLGYFRKITVAHQSVYCDNVPTLLVVWLDNVTCTSYVSLLLIKNITIFEVVSAMVIMN